MVRALGLAIAFGLFMASMSVRAQDVSLLIRDHRFEPAEIKVPSGKRVVISISNEDATPEEFESGALKVEKVIPGKSKTTVRVGPLKPGRYEFIGEYHADTAKGVLIAE
jgi:plastocyanin